ncbi:Holin [Gammaproteobacteria bacterium]
MEYLTSLTRMAKEPSTWAGVGVAALLAGQSTDKITAITNLIAALSALVAAFMPENVDKARAQNNDEEK